MFFENIYEGRIAYFFYNKVLSRVRNENIMIKSEAETSFSFIKFGAGQ